jgi:hypothetical protein
MSRFHPSPPVSQLSLSKFGIHRRPIHRPWSHCPNPWRRLPALTPWTICAWLMPTSNFSFSFTRQETAAKKDDNASTAAQLASHGYVIMAFDDIEKESLKFEELEHVLEKVDML